MKYKLKKELPCAKVGTEYEDEYFLWTDKEGSNPIHIICKNHPDWFEPIEERWPPKKGELFYTIDIDMGPHPQYFDDYICSHIQKLNFFQTNEQATRASLKIKEALKQFWEGEKNDWCGRWLKEGVTCEYGCEKHKPNS